jgi:TolB-like protein
MKNLTILTNHIALPLKKLNRLFFILFLCALMYIPSRQSLLGQSTSDEGASAAGISAVKTPDLFIKRLIADIYSEWPDLKNEKVSAVLPFYRESIENSNAFGTYLAETCSDMMVKEHQLKVVSRSRLRNFIEELEFQQDELVKKSTRKDLGQFLGADYILIGNFWYMKEVIKISVRVFDVESAYALTAASVFVPVENVPEDFLTEIQNDRQVDKAANQDLREQKLEELARLDAERRKALEKKTILSISVIPEDAMVSIEGIFIPQSKRANMEVSPGDYLVSANASGFKPSRETIVIEKGTHRVLAIKLVAEETALPSARNTIASGKIFTGGSWSPEGTKTSQGNNNSETETHHYDYSNDKTTPIISDYKTYTFYITMLRKQLNHIKNLEMTIDDIPITNLKLVNDMAHSNTLFKRTYSCSANLRNGSRRCNFAGKIKMSFFTAGFARERWVTINNQSSQYIKIKLGLIDG